MNEDKFKETANRVDEIDETKGFPYGSLFVAILCMIYLLNPLGGVDLIPDYIPVVGNLDEMGATLLLIRSVRKIKNRNQKDDDSSEESK